MLEPWNHSTTVSNSE